jgi:hypothetical protein
MDPNLAQLLGIGAATGLGIYGADRQSDALERIAREQGLRDDARYADLARREAERYADVTRREEARYGDIVSRDLSRYLELKERENQAIARQRGDIDYGRLTGGPYRERLAALYADPTSFLSSPEVMAPVQQGTDALARALSVRGNPAGSGAALQEIQNYASNQLFGRLGEEKTRLAGFGGLSAYNQSGASVPGIGTNLSPGVAGTGSIFPGNADAGAGVGTQGGLSALLGATNAQGGMYDWLNYGLRQATQPRLTSLI